MPVSIPTFTNEKTSSAMNPQKKIPGLLGGPGGSLSPSLQPMHHEPAANLALVEVEAVPGVPDENPLVDVIGVFWGDISVSLTLRAVGPEVTELAPVLRGVLLAVEGIGIETEVPSAVALALGAFLRKTHSGFGGHALVVYEGFGVGRLEVLLHHFLHLMKISTAVTTATTILTISVMGFHKPRRSLPLRLPQVHLA